MKRLWNRLIQIGALLRFALWSIPGRKGSVLTTLLSVAGVIGVFTGTFSMQEGFRKVLARSVHPAGAIVLRSGAESELVSILSREECRIVGDAVEVAQTNGLRLVSPELFVIVTLPRRSSGLEVNVPFRGVLRPGRLVHQNVRLVAGRWFVPGRREVVVGAAALREYRGLELGGLVRIGKTDWHVVGVFAAGGGVEESEIWTDAHLLQSLYRRGSTFSSVMVRLRSPALFESFKRRLESDPRLNIRVLRLSEYYGEQGRILSLLITRLGGAVTVIMLIGAVFAALNTMYAAVRARQRQLAVLRAIGFSEFPILIATLVEALSICFIGGLVGGGVVFLLFHGFRTATMNLMSFSQVVFAFEVNWRVLCAALGAASLIGLVGGLAPAWKATRISVAQVLRGG